MYGTGTGIETIEAPTRTIVLLYRYRDDQVRVDPRCWYRWALSMDVLALIMALAVCVGGPLCYRVLARIRADRVFVWVCLL